MSFRSLVKNNLPLSFKNKPSKGFSAQKRFSSSYVPPHLWTTYTGEKYFDKILIANRGEIACRIIRTAKRLGIKTVAIYSEPDANAMHVRMADEAYCVGPAATRLSYLNIPNILQIVKDTGAQAVHPGYGFLSENSEFVKSLEDHNVVFIGPDSFAMHAMGDKIESKKLAKKSGVHTIPGFLGEVDGDEAVLKISREIGYPVMIKASAGGGGKGMRIAWNDKEALEGFRLSKQEAKSSFGDDRMLIEKFIDNPRHIEIQILADGQGTTLGLPERECSIQRRNQKVLEEAPSTHLDETTRRAMQQQAVSLAAAVKYKTAGTVEFLVDSQKNFYFLEMNTRLQVEHPITEYITGIDLVEQMIRVASGRKLLIKQEDIKIQGWAMESRVYAEDPLKKFLPSIGPLLNLRNPETGYHVRVDSGVQEGSDISVFYDPLISKLSTYGKDRNEAIEKMRIALDTYVIRGLNHNVCFLRDMMSHPRYLSGNISTKFIPEEYPKGYFGHPLTPVEQSELVSSTLTMHFMRKVRDLSISGQIHGFNPASVLFAPFIITLHDDGSKTGSKKWQARVIESSNNHQNLKVELLDKQTNATQVLTVNHQWPVDDLVLKANIDNKDCIFQLITNEPLGYKVQYIGSIYTLDVRTPQQEEYSKHMIIHEDAKAANQVISPMPGMLLSVAVKVGDSVIPGQELAVVEAMKMQNMIRAEREGIVKSIPYKAGTEVPNDAVLIEYQ